MSNLLRYTRLGNAKGPLVFMVHGWPDRAVPLFKKQIAALQDTHDLVLCDIPGYEDAQPGTNPPLPFFGFSVDEIAELLHNTIQSVVKSSSNKNNNNEKPILIGHDWGAIISNSFCSRHSDTISRVVLLDVGTDTSVKTLYAAVVIVAYQWTAIFCFLIHRFISAALSNLIHQKFTALFRAPNSETSTGLMGYMYLQLWIGILTLETFRFPKSLSYKQRSKQQPNPYSEYDNIPVLYMFAAGKPFMFHTSRWVSYVNEKGKSKSDGSQAVGFDTKDHWFFNRGKFADEATEKIVAFVKA